MPLVIQNRIIIMSRIYDATLVKNERVSASKLLKLLEREQENVKFVRFVLPKLGRKNDFGHFEVDYKQGVYAVIK